MAVVLYPRYAIPLFIFLYSSSAAIPTRRLRRVSSAYGRVWHGSELHVGRLLDACHVFADALEQTGPQAVKRDFNGNLVKAKELAQSAPKGSRERHRHIKTLGDILKYEQSVLKLHHGNKLKDPSGAVGFLWMRRSLEFQAELYKGLINGKSSKDAAVLAYKAHLRPYHGPILRRFYTTFFQYNMPSRDVMLRRLGATDGTVSEDSEHLVIEDLESLVRTWHPILAKWKRDFVRLDLEDPRAV